MNYTVNDVATLSGVSVRTLHYYDEIGLLKPAFVGENNYRYYQEEQLLLLQQILFFKELGMGLKQIQEILEGSDFDTMKALELHAHKIKERVAQLQKLSKTISKTIKHIEGKYTMKEQELYYGFSQEKQDEYEQFLINKYGDKGSDRIAESKRNIKNWTQEDWKNYKLYSDSVYRQLVEMIDKGILANDTEVQKLIKKHYELISKFYDPTKEVYSGLGDLYTTHPDFRKLFETYHMDLPEFLSDAMRVYADTNL